VLKPVAIFCSRIESLWGASLYPQFGSSVFLTAVGAAPDRYFVGFIVNRRSTFRTFTDLPSVGCSLTMTARIIIRKLNATVTAVGREIRPQTATGDAGSAFTVFPAQCIAA
jgi:hypothetical protein